MNRIQLVCLIVLIFMLSGCKPGVEAPAVEEIASPEAVALSLSTVDPEESLHLFEYDRQAPLDIRETRRWHEGGATWIDFTYASPQGARVDARLVIPDGKGPFPGIILQHGGPGTLEDMVYYARDFAKYGAVSIMITSPYRRPGGYKITQYMGNTWPLFTERDLGIKIEMIDDLQRAVDILLERPEVDPERLAYLGVSFGGAMGGLLAGVEDRLAAYVLVVGDGGLVEHTADPGEDGLNLHFSEDWAALMWPTEPLHFVGQAAPAALLFQNGIHDTFVPPRDATRFQTAASEPKTVIWYDAGHNLPWQFVNDAAKWLQPYLGNRLFLMAPNYRSSAIVVEWVIIAIVLVSVGIFIFDTLRRKNLTWGDRLVWLLGMILLVLLGLAIYWLTTPRDRDSSKPTFDVPFWRQVLGITTLTTISFIAGFFLGDKLNDILLSGADFRLRFLQLYLTALIVGGLLTLLNRRTYQASILAKILVINLLWAAVMIFPALLRQVFSYANWALYPVDTMIGILISLPLHAWMLKRGLEVWQPERDGEARLKRLGWPVNAGLLVLSYLVVLGSVVVVVQVYTGLPWREVILILRGVYL
jgi:dienelactone hydrolase